jgi:SAM-dependent methyltransferase
MVERAASHDRERAVVSSSAMEGATNYFRWQHDLLASHIGDRVLEVGCGIGGFTRTLLGRERVVSVDLNPEMIELLRERLGGHPEWHGLAADLTDPDFPERVAPHRCDSVTALNVIEHIETDEVAFRTLRKLLPEGGRAAVLVPAHQALFGSFDAAVGHYRRYTTAGLAEKMGRAGFRVDRTLYFNMVGALGWWVNYRLLRVRWVNKETTLQVGLFDRWLVPLVRRLESGISPPFGLSAICLATAR